MAKLDVYHKTTAKGVNAEEGLIGVTADPNYAKTIMFICFMRQKIQRPIDYHVLFLKMGNWIWQLKKDY